MWLLSQPIVVTDCRLFKGQQSQNITQLRQQTDGFSTAEQTSVIYFSSVLQGEKTRLWHKTWTTEPASQLTTCGAARTPALLFLPCSDAGGLCGWGLLRLHRVDIAEGCWVTVPIGPRVHMAKSHNLLVSSLIMLNTAYISLSIKTFAPI